MNQYLNVTIKIDISLCEMTLGFIYIYIYNVKNPTLYRCVYLNLIKVNVLWIWVYMF